MLLLLFDGFNFEFVVGLSFMSSAVLSSFLLSYILELDNGQSPEN
jgi:hypothetical protein